MRAPFPFLLPAAALLLCLAPGAAAFPPQAVTTGAGGDPAQAMHGLLAAACGQNQPEFARFLPARSARSYARLTAPSRVALMKRFSFLDAPGRAVSTESPSGRPAVRCETPARTVEIQIDGAEIQENLAYLPLEVSLSGGAPESTQPRRIQIGLVLEGGSWKLLSAGLLLLDLPALEMEWNRESLDANESNAVATLRLLAQAVENYRRTYARLPERIEQLGPPARGPASAAAAGLVDAELAAGSKSGYHFRYVIVGASSQGALARFEAAAVPLAYGTTGRRSFFLDVEAVLHGGDRLGAMATSADSRIGSKPPE